MARLLHRADTFLLRVSGGKWTFAQLSGLPIVEMTTTGAKTGKQRTLPITGFPDGVKYALIASNFGQDHHPAWYYNLKANPECVVKKNGEARTYIAREADEQENKYYYDMAISYYIGYAAYKQRAKNRKIPVMVLEPKPRINSDKHRKTQIETI
ncbi:MAG: nitroreductase family deazaflavin-dependent oxidoreductase [Anaerolineales bacterium]